LTGIDCGRSGGGKPAAVRKAQCAERLARLCIQRNKATTATCRWTFSPASVCCARGSGRRIRTLRLRLSASARGWRVGPHMHSALPL